MPDSSRAGAAPDAREGTRLGRFHVIERLGSGGMGVVYRALDGDQPVALKLIAPDLAERSDIHARFQREARVASDLRHPHIGEVRALEHIGGQGAGDGALGGRDAASAPGEFRFSEIGGRQVVQWTEGDLSYALVSSVPGQTRTSCSICHAPGSGLSNVDEFHRRE